MTTAGLFGTIEGLEGDTMLLRVADGVTVRFARAAVARRISDDVADDAAVHGGGCSRPEDVAADDDALDDDDHAQGTASRR